MKKNSLVTIITPTFNRIEYIEETVSSVINQTYQNWEYIIVDDGSDDDNFEFIKQQCERDKRIRLIRRYREPKGASTCRNIGIEKSKGEYLMFLDSDDLLSANCIENRCEHMIKDNQLQMLIHPLLSFNGSLFYTKDILLLTYPDKNEYINAFLKHKLPWLITNVFWNTTFLKKIKGFDETFERYQDVELHLRALAQNPHFEVRGDIPPDCFYRLPNSKRWLDNLNFREKVVLSSFKLEEIKYKLFNSKLFRKSRKQGFRFIFFSYIIVNKENLNKLVDKFIQLGLKYKLITFCDLLLIKVLRFLFKFYKIKFCRILYYLIINKKKKMVSKSYGYKKFEQT